MLQWINLKPLENPDYDSLLSAIREIWDLTTKNENCFPGVKIIINDQYNKKDIWVDKPGREGRWFISIKLDLGLESMRTNFYLDPEKKPEEVAYFLKFLIEAEID